MTAPSPESAPNQPLDHERLLSAWALGLLEPETAAAVERNVRSKNDGWAGFFAVSIFGS